MVKEGRIPANAGKRYVAEILTPTEVGRLIDACSKRAPTGIRNRALITTLYSGGLRIAEALALYPDDVDRDWCTLRVLYPNDNRNRAVSLAPEPFDVLERWLEKRAERGLRGENPLFCTLGGGKLDSSYVRALLPRLARKAGIEKRVHAHGLRHTHAAELAREGLAVDMIRAQLGHAKPGTTRRYLAHIASVEVIEAMKARHRPLKARDSSATSLRGDPYDRAAGAAG